MLFARFPPLALPAREITFTIPYGSCCLCSVGTILIGSEVSVPEAESLTPEQRRMVEDALREIASLFDDERLAAHLVDRIRQFQGNFDVLESAVGALVVGRVVGWRVLKLVHSPRTYRIYEDKLGLKFSRTFPWSDEPVMPERGPFVKKSVALKITDRLGNFWDVVRTGRDVPKKKAESI